MAREIYSDLPVEGFFESYAEDFRQQLSVLLEDSGGLPIRLSTKMCGEEKIDLAKSVRASGYALYEFPERGGIIEVTTKAGKDPDKNPVLRTRILIGGDPSFWAIGSPLVLATENYLAKRGGHITETTRP